MIELKIPISTAVMLITERMKLEFSLRKKAKLYPPECSFYNLSYKQLLNLVEVSVIDLVFLLPAEIHFQNNNLYDILFKAIRQLSNIFSYDEFSSYPYERAQQLIKPIRELFRKTEESDFFLYN